MKKLKVLIIPSWYPNEKDPLWGNYFIRQADALNTYADVSMLYVNRIGMKEIKKLSKERRTDGYSETTHSFKFYKKTIINLKSVSLNYSYKKYAKASYEAYKKLTLFIDKPDVIIAESVLPAGISAKYISKKEGIPYIIHAHSENIMSNPLYESYVLDILKDADGYMGVNNSIVDIVKKKGKRDCELVPNFIDCKKYDIKRTRKDDDFILVNMCNFYKVKAVDVLLKAVDIVVNKKGHKDVKLRIIGTGEYEDYYKSIANSLKLNDNVIFTGYMDNKLIPNELVNANALCVSSTFETFCIPIIESLASGIPVITTDCKGPLEIVNEKNSIVVKIGDIDGFADAIIKMKENYKKYNKKTLQKYVFNKYDKSVICKKILNICEGVINSK